MIERDVDKFIMDGVQLNIVDKVSREELPKKADKVEDIDPINAHLAEVDSDIIDLTTNINSLSTNVDTLSTNVGKMGNTTNLYLATLSDSSYTEFDVDLTPYRYVYCSLLGKASDNVWCDLIIPTSMLSNRSGDFQANDRHRLFIFSNATTYIGYHLYVAKNKIRIINGGSSTWTASNFRLLVIGIK